MQNVVYLAIFCSSNESNILFQVRRRRKFKLFDKKNLLNKMHALIHLGLLLLHTTTMIPSRRVTQGELGIEKLNQHHSTGWPNVFNTLNSTMLNTVGWKC